MFGDHPEHEIRHRCQSLMGHPTKMKRFWMEKSCLNILSTEVKKLSMNDVTQFESDPQFCFSVKLLTVLAREFEDLISHPIAFKTMLLLLFTSPVQKLDTKSSFENVVLKTFSRRLDVSTSNSNHLSKIIQNMLNALDQFKMLSGSINFLSNWIFKYSTAFWRVYLNMSLPFSWYYMWETFILKLLKNILFLYFGQ